MLFIVLLICLSTSCFSLESNFHRTEKCAQKNGFCVLESECPHNVESSFKNLCGEQKGAVCCKDFPQGEVNCYQTHNECRKNEECPKHLNMGSKGCEPGTVCCVLV
ncbi:hypothetical protein HHI36_006316 [Cryptolaemus montrouzieri]|uniref:Carboxypeptidase inhibitor n=1 Tax=Cryptolaemus montrouzieri TaxID=559131 RepID=A0ABD2NXN6_9CUCU